MSTNVKWSKGFFIMVLKDAINESFKKWTEKSIPVQYEKSIDSIVESTIDTMLKNPKVPKRIVEKMLSNPGVMESILVD